MPKLLTSKWGVRLLYVLITAGLVTFNVINAANVRNLKSEFDSVNQKYEARKFLVDKAFINQHKLLDLSEKQRRHQTVFKKLVTHKNLKQLDPSSLLHGPINFIISPDEEMGSNVIRLLTSETEKLEVLYRITYLEPRSTKHGRAIDGHQFVIPLKPLVWNVFGLGGEGEVAGAVISIVDGERRTVGSVPEFVAGKTTSSRSPIAGNFKPDADGDYYVAEPYKTISRRLPADPDDPVETLQIGFTIRKARE